MTTFLVRLLIAGFILTCAGCGTDARKDAEKALKTIGASELRREAANFYKELFVAPNGKFFVPKYDQWPRSFRRLEPLNVRAYTDGFSLTLLDDRTGEQGLYIVPAGMDGTPREGRNARFQKIDEGIYWYWFTD